MSIDTNNIKVKHLNENISIAQHTEYEGGVSEVTIVQEVAILPSHSDDWVIMRYDNTLDSLIETLQNARTIIKERKDIKHDIPKVWDADDIIDTYDSSPDITLKELSLRSGWSVRELLSLLTHDANYHD